MKLLVLGLFLFIAPLFFAAGYFSNKGPDFPFSKDILSFTDESHELQGTVINISDDKIKLAVAVADQKTKEFQVKLLTSTGIYHTPQTRIARFPGIETEFPNIMQTKSALAKGQTVYVVTKQDLRLVKDNMVDADKVTIAPKIMQLEGVVLRIDESSFDLEVDITHLQAPSRNQPRQQPVKKQVFTIELPQGTKYYQAFFAKDPESAAQSDVKVKDEVAVHLREEYKSDTPITAEAVMKKPVIPKGTPPVQRMQNSLIPTPSDTTPPIDKPL